MECPKCGYLGFDDTPRCRNCSYDFALVSTAHDVALDDIDDAISTAHGGVRAAAEPDWLELSALDPGTASTGARQVFDVSDLDALLQKAEANGVAAPEAGPSPSPFAEPALPRTLPAVDLDLIDPVRATVAPAADLVDDVMGWPEAPSSPARPRAERPAFDMAALDNLDIKPAGPVSRPVEPATAFVGETLDRAEADRVVPSAGPETRAANPPVFGGAPVDDDAPLVRLQRPRAPISVRKTPMSPKLRAVARTAPQEPAFDFLDPAEPVMPTGGLSGEGQSERASALENSPPLRRLAATGIDAVLFAGIDLAVLYLTFRIVGLSVAEWRVLPAWPVALFLVGMKLSYASVFTALGGQTIGKMAAGIRVVSMDDRSVSPGASVRRTLVSLVAVATAGLGYLPGLVGRERRAIHDRVSGTRVVLLPAA